MGDRGGPRLWKGLLDDSMTMHIRHLLLDGWLTLWADDKNVLYLQPSSLALLYWAALQVDMPYTDTPENFINNYDWSKIGRAHV